MLSDDGRSQWMPEPGAQPPLRDLSCGALLDDAAPRWPDHDALVYAAYADEGVNGRWSFSRLREDARAVGRALLARGLQKGDRVALWATNIPQWLLLQFGAAYAGVVLVPLNPL